MSNRVQGADRDIGQNDPVILLLFGLIAKYLRELFQHALALLGVNQLEGLFELGRAAGAPGIQSKQTERLIRVVLHLPKDVIVDPTPRVRQPLRFGEIRFTLPQSLFCALALRQVEYEADSLVLTFKHRKANQNGHSATVLPNALPFERLHAPGTLELSQDIFTITVAPSAG